MNKIFFFAMFFFSFHFYGQETITDTVRIPKSYTLEDVQVFGKKREYIKIEHDKTTIDVKNNVILNNGSSFDAVKRIPGVIKSPMGGLLLNGKDVTVYVDGRPIIFSGTDLQNYLSSLPAGTIEKIELIYKPDASYDANSSGSVINIVTNSKGIKGLNASYNLNYGLNRYQKPSSQILLNGKEKDLNWQTVLGYSYSDSEVLMVNNQIFSASNPMIRLKQGNFIAMTNRNLFFRVGTNYKLTENSHLLFNYNGSFANDRNEFNTSTTGELINYTNIGTTKNKNSSHEISFQFNTKLDTLGRSLDIVVFSNIFDKKPITNAIDNNKTANDGTVKFNLNNNYVKFDFEIPFQKYHFSINTGGKYNSIKVNDAGVFNTSNGLKNISFDYNESNLAFYASIHKKIEKLRLSAGVRFEDFSINRSANTLPNPIKFNKTNFFPNISALYEFNEDITASASYSKKIKQPNYDSLDPNNSAGFDQYNSSQGDLFLKPAFHDNYELKISAFQFVSLGVDYTKLKDNNLVVFNAPASGQIISNQTFQQFEKFNTLSTNLSFPIPLDYFLKGKEEFSNRKNDMEKMNYIFVNLNYIKSDAKGVQFPFKNKAIINYSAQAQILLPWEIKSTISYFILSAGTWQVYNVNKSIQQFDIAFNKKFFNKNLNVVFSATDFFNTNNVNAVVIGQNLNTNFYKKEDSRSVRISLTYNFGNLKLSNENTQIETEKIKSAGGLVK